MGGVNVGAEHDGLGHAANGVEHLSCDAACHHLAAGGNHHPAVKIVAAIHAGINQLPAQVHLVVLGFPSRSGQY